jgi:hypothetical protein
LAASRAIVELATKVQETGALAQQLAELESWRAAQEGKK